MTRGRAGSKRKTLSVVLSQGKTVIAIAHRLSTILKADEIIFLEKGKVIGKGRHGELMESCPEYRKLYNLQFEGHGLHEIVADVDLVAAGAEAST